MAMLVVDNVTLPSPSKFEWSIQDVSLGESGRDDAGYMYKSRVTSKRKILLEWQGIKPATAKTILEAFQPEYIHVTYFDPLTGADRTMEAYIGDRHAPVKVWQIDNKIYETISLDVIER